MTIYPTFPYRGYLTFNNSLTTMNYVGSVSILDRGDAPAREVLDKNARSLAQRTANETKDELEKVMSRVDTIYVGYESSTQQMFANKDLSLEYLNDIAELEELLKDQIKKRKYQQQVTVFIVGYENVSTQKLRLLQQVNEFFITNSKSYEEEDWFPKTPDLDLEDVGLQVEDSLSTAEELARRLGDLNKEMVDWLTNYAHTKATSKNKKKLEKSLQQAKEDVNSLGEKLLTISKELEEKDEKMQTMIKQLEVKNMEVQKFRTAAEVAKKNIQDTASHTTNLQDEIVKRDEQIEELQQQVSKLEVELASASYTQEKNQERISNLNLDSQKKIFELQKEVEANKLAADDAKHEMEKFHDQQVKNVENTHKNELEQLKTQHGEEMEQLEEELSHTRNRLVAAEQQAREASEEVEYLRVTLADLEERGEKDPPTAQNVKSQTPPKPESEEGSSRHSSRQDSRPNTKDSKVSRQSSVGSKTSGKSLATKSPTKKSEVCKNNPYIYISVQDEGGDPNNAQVEEGAKGSKPGSFKQSQRPQSKLETVQETDSSEFNDAFSLLDDESWAAVTENIPGRFSQYRKMSQKKVKELEEQLQLTVTKTRRKVQSLKSQFQEHKTKWEDERRVLVEQIDQAQSLQNEAEHEADAAMSQLESFINDQEKLEEEEETKRREMVESDLMDTTEALSESPIKDQQADTPALSTPHGEQGHTSRQTELAEPSVEPATPPPQTVQSEDTEQELDRLMQQTDDAKVQELHARISSGAMSAPPSVAHDQEDKENKEKSRTEPNSGLGKEELQSSSAKSRASLRSQYRMRLEETRLAAEDRRSKSPVISVMSHKSMEEAAIFLEDDEDDELPFTDEVKEDISGTRSKSDTNEAGTSPPPGRSTKASGHSISTKISKHSVQFVDHPVVHEYLKAYEEIMQFKERLSKVFTDKELLSASQILTEMETVKFDGDAKIQPQVESMTQNIFLVLSEITAILHSVIVMDQEPEVSTIAATSRDATRRNLLSRNKSADSGRGPTITRGSAHSSMTHPTTKSTTSDHPTVKELQEQYERLQQTMEGENKKHEEQLRHNTVVMMEMQDTINELQRELAALGHTNRRASSTGSQHVDSAVMFTRLDSERNAKIMKKAVVEQKLPAEQYKHAVLQMDHYVSLPAKRLAHLVRKYVHHSRMKAIEENVKKSRSLDEKVFGILDKMEGLQNERAKTWADHMDEMGVERLRMANLLMETLDNIEQESGIFLIKPMYSYRSRDSKEQYFGKLSRPSQPRKTASPARRDIQSAYAPAPTPASNIRGLARQEFKMSLQHPGQPIIEAEFIPQESHGPLEGDESGLMGEGLTWVGSQSRPIWNIGTSQIRSEEPGHPPFSYTNFMNTPRILELDINRMLIGQNTISSKLHGALTDDRLINLQQNSLRSYVTVSRPNVLPGQIRSERPRSHSGHDTAPASSAPPSMSAGHRRTQAVDMDLSTSRGIPSTPPLPPISTHKGRQLSPELRAKAPSPPASGSITSPINTQEHEVLSPIR
ncbi:hypothetical protein ScPMuIL_003424 [Solemya velum]